MAWRQGTPFRSQDVGELREQGQMPSDPRDRSDSCAKAKAGAYRRRVRFDTQKGTFFPDERASAPDLAHRAELREKDTPRSKGECCRWRRRTESRIDQPSATFRGATR